MNDNFENEDWRGITEAAKLVGVSYSKISRLVLQGRLRSRKDPYDERKNLVNMSEVWAIFPRRRR
jgi:excisionase family DNA binding protein